MAILFGVALSMPASATHSVCHNQALPEDVDLGLVGVDTGINDGTGTHVCIGSTSYGVDVDDPEDGGTGAVIEVLNCEGDNNGQPCPRLLSYTGISVNTDGPGTVTLYVYVDGDVVDL